MDENNSRLETEKRSSQKESFDDTQNFSFSPRNSIDLINKQNSEGAPAQASAPGTHVSGNVTVGPVIGLIALDALDEIKEEKKDDTNPGSARNVHEFEVNPINVALYDNDQNQVQLTENISPSQISPAFINS